MRKDTPVSISSFRLPPGTVEREKPCSGSRPVLYIRGWLPSSHRGAGCLSVCLFVFRHQSRAQQTYIKRRKVTVIWEGDFDIGSLAARRKTVEEESASTACRPSRQREASPCSPAQTHQQARHRGTQHHDHGQQHRSAPHARGSPRPLSTPHPHPPSRHSGRQGMAAPAARSGSGRSRKESSGSSGPTPAPTAAAVAAAVVRP